MVVASYRSGHVAVIGSAPRSFFESVRHPSPLTLLVFRSHEYASGDSPFLDFPMLVCVIANSKVEASCWVAIS